MNAKKICDWIQMEIDKIEAEQSQGMSDLQKYKDAILNSQIHAHMERSAKIDEYDRQLERINIYLKQIPTNISFQKRIGKSQPFQESILSDLALKAYHTYDMNYILYYEQLYSVAMGMKQYLENQKQTTGTGKSQDTIQKEQIFLQKEQQLKNRISAKYEKLFQNENYALLVQRIADTKIRIRDCVTPTELLVGRRYTRMQFPPIYANKLRQDFGNDYDEKKGRLLIPFSTDISKGFKILLKSKSDMEVQDEMVESILYSLVDKERGKEYVIQYIDKVRMTGAGLRNFQIFLNEPSGLFYPVPRNELEVETALDKFLKRGDRIEELLQKSGKSSLYEWNAFQEKDNRKKKVLLVLEGFPSSYSQRQIEKINKLMVNASRWGISFLISVDMKKVSISHKDWDKFVTNFYLDDFMKINCPSNNIKMVPPGRIDKNLTKLYEKQKKEVIEKTQYTDWFQLRKAPDYTKTQPYVDAKTGKSVRIPIRFPLGVNKMGQLHYVEMEGMNFAGYLMGGSGSGKTSVIHTIIASITYNYHPDDVEIWLADFKMTEFAQYIEDTPPHVKYVVLDYSPKVVFDLLDRISAEMVRRTDLFVKHPEWNKDIKNVPLSAKLPKIFLIIDEFEKMANIIAANGGEESAFVYRKKITALLEQGRALGFRILFASQNYKNGVSILEANAKNNIGLRIAMKNQDTSEMKGVLEMKSDVDDEMNKTIQFLPEHQLLLVEKNVQQQRMYLHRLKSLWFKEEREIRRLQRNLNKYFMPVLVKEEGNIRQYFSKDTDVINGKSLNSFEEISPKLEELTKRYRGDVFFDDDVAVYPGNIQSMEQRRPIWITTEKNQHMCLLAGQPYTPYAASVILSTVKCFEQAKNDIVVFGYRRNPIFAKYKNIWQRYGGISDVEMIERNLKSLVEKMRQGINEPCLIVLCGATELLEEAASVKKEWDMYQKEDRNLKAGIGGLRGDSKESRNGIRGLSGADSDRRKETGASAWQEEDIMTQLKRQAKAEMQKNKETQNTAALGLGMKQDGMKVSESVVDLQEMLQYIQSFGAQKGVHLLTVVGNVQDMDLKSKIKADYYAHLFSFKIPEFGSVTRLKEAVKIGNGDEYADDSICVYSGLEKFSFRPFLHKDIVWNGWVVDENGKTKQAGQSTE